MLMKEQRFVLRSTLLVILLPLACCHAQPGPEQGARPSESAAEVATLIEALHSIDPGERRNAALALGRMGERAAPAIPALIRSLGDRARLTVHGPEGKDSPASVAEAAMMALANLGPPAVEPLVDALKNDNPGVRMTAAEALGRIEDARGVEGLIELLESDPDPLVQAVAVDALRNKREARVLEALLVAERSGSWVVKSLARSAVQDMSDLPGKEDPSGAGREAGPLADPPTVAQEGLLEEPEPALSIPKASDGERTGEGLTPSAVETAPRPAAVAPDSAAEKTHIVEKDENLYRIGLKYGVPWQTLMQLNGLTDPAELAAGRQLRIPAAPEPAGPAAAGSEERSIGGALAGSGPLREEQTCIVQPGDNLYRIGRRFGVPWQTLLKHNNLRDPGALFVGQKLRIPAPAAGAVAGTPTLHGETTYTVQDGDILYDIGLLYGMDWREIAERNGLSEPYDIFVGQILKIPTRGEPPSP
jgi:LysM repeat protein